jgi:hypothetical protein
MPQHNFLQRLLNGLVEIANKMGFYEKKDLNMTHSGIL